MKRTLGSVALSVSLVVAVGGGNALAAGEYDHLLAPTSVCPGQLNTAASIATQEKAMLCLHNYVRSKKRLPSLATRSLLLTATDRKSADIVRCQEFSHQACGRETFFHTKRVGYAQGCWGAGENIAWGSGKLGSARSIMRAWLESDGHRENILRSKFRDKGVALVKGRFKGYSNAQVWTTQFGYRC
jgi:uncharacterized protein YkwD